MNAMASQITGVSIAYATACSGADQRKHWSTASLAFAMGNSPVIGEFPAQRGSNAKNVSIWWRHHVFAILGINDGDISSVNITNIMLYYHFWYISRKPFILQKK